MAKAYNKITGEFLEDGTLILVDIEKGETIEYPPIQDVEITHMTVWSDTWQKSYKKEGDSWVEVK